MKKRRSYVLFALILLTGSSLSGRPLWTDTVENHVDRFIRSHVRCDSLSVTVNMDHRTDGAFPAPTVRDVHIDWNKDAGALTGKVYLPVRILSGDGRTISCHVTACIRRYERICVAGRILERNHVLTAADLKLELRETSRMDRQVSGDIQNLIGNRIRRGVGMGRIITHDLVEPLPAVMKGDRVTVLIQKKNLILSTTGIARQDGWIGNRIRVRKTESYDEFIGSVDAAGRIVID